MSKKLFILLMVVLVSLPAAALGQGDSMQDVERIESFSSRIAILPEGGIEVTETVVLVSHGEKLPWGLERSLPRWNQSGQASEIEIMEVLRNGAPAEYGLSETDAGLVVQVGDPDLPLAPGRYVYSISYRCSRLIYFLPYSEHLHWNATGSWPVPLERVAVSLEFARTPRPGFQDWSATVTGEQSGNWRSSLEDENWLQFHSTRPLAPGEAMLVQAAWPKGYALPPSAQGRILALACRVNLDAKGRVQAQEEITLYNEGKFAEGFYRDFPYLYAGNTGKRRISKLDVEEVRLNGELVPWNLENFADGMRLAVGPLPPGNSVLAIRYSLDRQVLLSRDLEQLHWQMPGYFCPVEIEQITYTLELPEEIPRKELILATFTGQQGDAGKAVFHYLDGKGEAVFATTRALERGENLYCSVAWPAGYLEPAPWSQHLLWTLRDSASAVIALAVMFLLVSWYFAAWLRVGRRPLGKTAPDPTPPDKLSPAVLRFLRRGGYDNRTFTAAVLSLAVKGCLLIVEEGGNFALVSSGVRPYLPVDEEALMNSLFAKRMTVFPAKHQELLHSARKAHKKQLSRLIKGKLLKANRGWFYPAVLFSLAGIALSAWLMPAPIWGLPGLAGFALWCSLIALVAARTLDLAPSLADDRGVGVVTLALLGEVILVLALSFIWGRWLAGIYDWLTVAAVVGIVGVNTVFSRLLVAPTPEGRAALKHTEGFRRWLRSKEGKAESEDPSSFEKYLPYAVALDATSRWGRRFSPVKGKGSLSPRWYNGSRWHTINAETLAAALSTLPRSKQTRL